MSDAHDFDFFHGSWHVEHRKLRRRLVRCDEWDEFSGTVTCWPATAGFGNVDDNWLDDPSGAYGALAMRAFDPADGVWSIWWLDQRSPQDLDPPVVGRFADGVGTFETPDTFEGRPILVRFRWLDTATAHPRWEQAFSPDDGITWEANWHMRFRR
ncbi:MAG: hypothetical protein R2715_18325 [Ilumatobacteraceae bacterium]